MAPSASWNRTSFMPASADFGVHLDAAPPAPRYEVVRRYDRAPDNPRMR
jgi:hypothetical protein